MENSNLRLVYCFSKKLALNDTKFYKAISLLKKSIEVNSKFHQVKVITDEETADYLIDVDIEILNFDNFYFLDDIKIQVLPLLKKNDILIDFDIFLGDILEIDSNVDIILDRPSYITETYYRKEIELSRKYKFSKLLNYNPNKNEIGNIGIMKFLNKELEKKYIDFYTKVKETALTEKNTLLPFPSFSMLLGQIGLKNIIDDNDYSISYTSQISKNNYFHLAGEAKYNEIDIESSISRLNKTLI